tara:strand:- start:3303 stop:3449 length:147 start_codon:yes stop_codon:yes gene_type:complete
LVTKPLNVVWGSQYIGSKGRAGELLALLTMALIKILEILCDGELYSAA